MSKISDNLCEAKAPSGVFAYFAIPVETFQSMVEQQTISGVTTIPQNFVIKTLTDDDVYNIGDQFTKTPTSSLPAAQQQTNSVCEQTTEIQNETKSKAKSQAKKSTNLKCLICKTTFEKVSLYRKHVLEHRNAKKFKCAECSASYNIEDNYKLHMAIHSKGPPCCPLCDRKFQRHASLKAHLIVHEVDETIACIKCLAEFDREEDLNSHMEVHKREEAAIGTSKTPLPLICSYCNYTFDDPKAYKEHVSYHVKVKKRRL